MKFPHSPEVGSGESSSNLFLKLKDKESVKGVFRGEPYVFHSKWENGKSFVCDPSDEKARFRFRINFVYQENGAFTTKMWEQGATTYNQLKDLNEEFDISKTVVAVKRSGIGMDTTYSIIPTKEGALNETQEKLISAVKLHDLKHKDPKTTADASDFNDPSTW